MYWVAEQPEAKRQLLTRCKEEYEIYRTALEVIKEAYSQTVAELSHTLAQDMGEYLAVLTEGKYGKVRQLANRLVFEVYSNSKDDWINTD